MSGEMKRSWLVQRLQKPRTGSGPLASLAGAFAFGGGRRNGGLTDEAMGLLREIFSFDYMGAAEFEHGALPEALNRIAETKKLVADSFAIPLAEVRPDWSDKSPAPAGEGTVYFMCPKGWQEEVEDRIRQWARDGYASRLKESTHIESSLRPFREWDGDTCGWVELDNGFFFFTDEPMWRATCSLFGIKVSESSHA